MKYEALKKLVLHLNKHIKFVIIFNRKENNID